MATGRIVLFLDDDVWLFDDYLISLLKAFDCGRYIAGTGFVRNQKPLGHFDGFFRKFFMLQDVTKGPTYRKCSGYYSFCNSPRGVQKTDVLWGCNLAVKRELLKHVSFDSSWGRLDDIYLSVQLQRLGELFLSEDACLYHYRSRRNRPSIPRTLLEQARAVQRLNSIKPRGLLSRFCFLWAMFGIGILCCLSVVGINLTEGTYVDPAPC
jgi:cellulose synthase/poly-beta-1,6-N-acetylglucosamine synthase-like glycosyltransferase